MKKNVTIKILATMVNILPDYDLAKDLKGARIAELVVDSSTEEIVLDNEGNVTEDGLDEEGNLKEGYSKKQEPVNKTEALNEENYKISKEIIQKRLKAYGINDYSVRLNNENGEITVELYENSNTDTAIYNLEYLGEFTVKDSETKETLLDNKDVKTAKAVYGTTETGTTVYLSIEFNKVGKKKLQEISRNYIETTDEEGKTNTKKVTINLDNDQLIETYFGEENTNGILQLSVGSATTDSSIIQNYIEQASRSSRINRFW